MKKYIILLFVLSIWGCRTQKQTSKYEPLSSNEFLENPFGIEESVERFKNKTKINYQVQKEIKQNRHYPDKSDTIYTLAFRKSEIHFYKTYTGKEFLLAGNISNRQIILRNHIRVGMKLEDFQRRFSGKLTLVNNQIRMMHSGIEFTFTFRNNKLAEIKFNNYID